MNQEMWSKSLLASYTILPKIAKCIDKTSMSLALSGFSYSGNTLDLMHKIIKNNSRKEALANAKVIVDDTLALLKPKHSEILKMKYMQKLSFDNTAEKLGICLRTVFRRYTLAIKSFAMVLNSKGYSAEWLESQYGDDPLFVRLNEVAMSQLQKNQCIKEKPQQVKKLAFVVASVIDSVSNEASARV